MESFAGCQHPTKSTNEAHVLGPILSADPTVIFLVHHIQQVILFTYSTLPANAQYNILIVYGYIFP